ncbi:hypothetical protein [Methylorubrum sp. GM97]|uniref:hypothetical protein n=1 Tax=Methylorubrum sp. GM97 TaxID=2938232 RepID=UPI0021C4BCB1|nr:hypothetical protein [Methylorubrum sp. GM97]
MPEHPPRESVVHAGPCTRLVNGAALRWIGEDVIESLDYVPGRFKIVCHVREAFAFCSYEQVVQTPAPPHRSP